MPLPLNRKKKAYLKGHRAEWIAAFYLRCKGYEVLKTRLKTPVGEIDLLVRKGTALVAVEVKARPTLADASFSIKPFQQHRIERALLYYLSGKKAPEKIRYDVILMAPWRWPYHMVDAWRSTSP